MFDPPMILETNHRVVRINLAMPEKLKMTPSETEGMSCHENFYGLREQPAFCPHSMLITGGREHSSEFLTRSI